MLAGRVTAEPYVRELPSGDHLVTWRISVARPPANRRPNQPADPITCVSFRPDIEEATRGWRIGDVVQVSGALRRRFWRSSKGSTSVIEVEAASVALLESASAASTVHRAPDSSREAGSETEPSAIAARGEPGERGTPGERDSASDEQ
ncbi:single-stranded DNA-binding protein [Nocardiopsis gilva YIM 90087]|uniref:Single-stranded DNA-binding protein n=1 Tax=Nocardiopsis gilva YIM 90087 TaxID=1235441 RepID=A0A223S911_9ACTN|nr:single-stranded DNA-binding protein [Nocardiopsis gilva YIM 90087]